MACTVLPRLEMPPIEQIEEGGGITQLGHIREESPKISIGEHPKGARALGGKEGGVSIPGTKSLSFKGTSGSYSLTRLN